MFAHHYSSIRQLEPHCLHSAAAAAAAAGGSESDDVIIAPFTASLSSAVS